MNRSHIRVGLVIERLEAWRGGAETSTLQFISHLVKHGCDVTVLTLSNAPSTPSMRIVPIKAKSPFRSKRTQLFVQRAADYARENPFDVVHSITPCLAADVYQPREYGSTIRSSSPVARVGVAPHSTSARKPSGTLPIERMLPQCSWEQKFGSSSSMPAGFGWA